MPIEGEPKPRSWTSRFAHVAQAVCANRFGPLVIVLTIGALLRLAAMLAAYPAIYHGRDMIRYLRIWPPRLFDDYFTPAGYPFVLRVLRMIQPEIAFVIVLQHIGGLAVGLLGYFFARRVGAPRSLAAATAIPALLSGDLLFMEHSISTEPLFTLLLATGLFLATIGIARQSIGFLALASCLFGLSALVRTVGLPLLAAPLVGVAIAMWRSPRILARAFLATVLPALVLLGAYAKIARSAGGFPALSDMSGYHLYFRVAPFVDCSRFDPPQGTAVLCESVPPSERQGPFSYSSGGPAMKYFNVPGQLFGFRALDERKNGLIREFAINAITHQPLDYLRAVTIDGARYFAPSLDKRPGYGPGPEFYDFRASLFWESEEWLAGLVSQKYRDAYIRRNNRVLEVLGTYASIARFNGFVLLLAIGGSIAGIALTREVTLRAVLIMLCLAAAALYLVPVFASTYEYRYGIPPQVPISWAGVIGCWAAINGVRRRCYKASV